MLILMRKQYESIIIGDKEVVFTILKVAGDQVKIGIKADPSVSIHRNEIYDKIKEQEQALLNTTNEDTI